MKRPQTPNFFTACITWYMTLKKLDINRWTDIMRNNYTTQAPNSDTHITNCCSFSIVQKRDKIISRMRHDCTKHTSNISTSKTDTELQVFAALILWSRNGMLIDQLNYGLKWSKLHHCVCRKEPFYVIQGILSCITFYIPPSYKLMYMKQSSNNTAQTYNFNINIHNDEFLGKK